jgi:hypothetical protein
MLQFQLDNSLRLLENDGHLSRTNSHELLVLNSFLGQQLKSFSLPSHAKFILWLTLQGDLYFRGGRAASERLSAARIGERVSNYFFLNYGNLEFGIYVSVVLAAALESF